MKQDYEIIDGKPHLGLWFGKHIYLFSEMFLDEIYLRRSKDLLNQFVKDFTPENTKTRYEEIIVKPPLEYYNNPLGNRGTIAIKFMIWGRAWRVMKLNKKNAKRYAKRRISGRIRRVRIDK